MSEWEFASSFGDSMSEQPASSKQTKAKDLNGPSIVPICQAMFPGGIDQVSVKQGA